jgi:hypothetical protein
MKTFSDLTAIDTKNKLKLAATVLVHGRIDYQFTVNGSILGTVQCFDLLDTIHLECCVNDLDVGHSGIEIISLTVNDLQILPLYLHMANPQTSYIDKIGVWQLTIPSPFYTWYHTLTGQGWIA